MIPCNMGRTGGLRTVREHLGQHHPHLKTHVHVTPRHDAKKMTYAALPCRTLFPYHPALGNTFAPPRLCTFRAMFQLAPPVKDSVDRMQK